MLDGRHTGTGGGNHVVLGGATRGRQPVPAAARSAAQPDHLLAAPSVAVVSVLGHVHRADEPGAAHRRGAPRLAATSSSSRSSRPDQARAAASPPWLVDRLFRNLLIDVTGNTHRAEFCIDKLYSPDRPTGRLGLVEFRAFEMPPHPRMSLAQQLLLLSLVARFWREPYRARPRALGHAAARPVHAAVFTSGTTSSTSSSDMQRAGYELDASWFAPHFEFRFPLLRRPSRFGGIEIELRQALEPWHVLGEEGAVGGTVRYVDSSVERLQVKVARPRPTAATSSAATAGACR